MTNWKAMQVPGVVVTKGQAPVHARPGDVRSKYLSMGSWHASLKAGGARKQK